MEEEKALVQAVKAHPYNLSKCFVTVGASINKSKGAVAWHWYNHTRFTEAGRKAMLTISRKSTYTGKNYCPGFRVRPTKKVRSASLWARLLTILRFK